MSHTRHQQPAHIGLSCHSPPDLHTSFVGQGQLFDWEQMPDTASLNLDDSITVFTIAHTDQLTVLKPDDFYISSEGHFRSVEELPA